MPSSPGYKRKYKQEVKTSIARGEREDRNQRNKARRKLKKAGVKVSGLDVDHKKGVKAGNGKSNLRAISKKKNRSAGGKKGKVTKAGKK